MTEEQAKELYHSRWWESKSAHDIVAFQLFEERVCMPFEIFYKAVEKCLNRAVTDTELVMNIYNIRKEFLEKKL